MMRGTHTKFSAKPRKPSDKLARDFIAALLEQYPVAIVLKAVPPIKKR